MTVLHTKQSNFSSLFPMLFPVYLQHITFMLRYLFKKAWQNMNIVITLL